MNKLVTILVASTFAVAATGAFAADRRSPQPLPPRAAKPALEKPASVKAEDWAKMSDADKAKAVEKAKARPPRPRLRPRRKRRAAADRSPLLQRNETGRAIRPPRLFFRAPHALRSRSAERPVDHLGGVATKLPSFLIARSALTKLTL